MGKSREEINRDRVLRVVRVDAGTGCWRWLGKMRGSTPITDGGLRATKWVWRKVTGEPVPKGAHLRRWCGVLTCVNPEHMQEFRRGKSRPNFDGEAIRVVAIAPHIVKQALSTGDVGRISFLRKVLVQSDGHWLWRGREHEGVPVTKRNGNPHASAALVAWTLWKGHTRIPEGKRLARMCDESRCVAPGHFALVNK